MGGFPTRPSRLALGPLGLIDRIPVKDPTKQVGAATFKLAWWQIAGLGVTTFQTFAGFDVTGAGAVAAAPESSGEAWDAEAGVAPTLVKQATGHYRLTYAADYPDEAGNDITTSFSDALPKVQTTSGAAVLYFAQAQILASGREVDIFVFNTAFAAADPINQRVAVWIY